MFDERGLFDRLVNAFIMLLVLIDVLLEWELAVAADIDEVEVPRLTSVGEFLFSRAS